MPSEAELAIVMDDGQAEPNDLSVNTFEDVLAAVEIAEKPAKTPLSPNGKLSADLTVNGRTACKIVRSAKGVSLNLD